MVNKDPSSVFESRRRRWGATGPEIGVPGFRWAWLTAVLLATYIVVFGLEQRYAIGTPGLLFGPTNETLVAMGALNRGLVRAGEWYRLVTAPFLHAAVPNLVARCLPVLLAAYALEYYVGRAWMFSIFTVGVVGGSVGSLLCSPPYALAAGAAGPGVAMLTCLFAVSFHPPAGPVRTRIRIQAAGFALPVLIPMGSIAALRQVDYGAHLGGAVAGLLVGLLLLATWREDSPLPGLRGIARTFAVMAVLVFAASAAQAALLYPAYLAALRSHGHTRAGPGAMAPTAGEAVVVADYPRSHGGPAAATRAATGQSGVWAPGR